MPTPLESYDVVIVGGGIAGLALGCALTKSGRSVGILEARSRVEPSKRGLTLQPNGLQALQQLSLLDEITKIGSKTRCVAWYEIAGDELAELDYSILDHPQNYLLTVIPSQLESVLRNIFTTNGGLIHESTSFLGFSRNTSGRLKVIADNNGSLVGLSTPILVGADGERSQETPSMFQRASRSIGTIFCSCSRTLLTHFKDEPDSTLHGGR